MASKEALSKKEFKAKIEEGWIHINVIYEMLGTPKDHVEKTLKLFLDEIAHDPHIIQLSLEQEETIPNDTGMFSTAAEVEYLIFGMEKLTMLAFNYMPASIEIKAPKELTFRERDVSTWLNDLLAKLHEVNTIQVAIKSEQEGLIRSLNASIRNNILLTLTEASTAKEIAKKIGMEEKGVLLVLEKMMKEGRVEQRGKLYLKK